MTLYEFLTNNGSTTHLFKQLPFDYELKLITHYELNGYLNRVVKISLASNPVIIGVSKVNVKHKLFYDILVDSTTQPIGLKLFGDNSPIKRKIIAIKPVSSLAIEEPKLDELLNKYDCHVDNIIYKRKSVFSYQEQTMELIEYVTHNLSELIKEL